MKIIVYMNLIKYIRSIWLYEQKIAFLQNLMSALDGKKKKQIEKKMYILFW